MKKKAEKHLEVPVAKHTPKYQTVTRPLMSQAVMEKAMKLMERKHVSLRDLLKK